MKHVILTLLGWAKEELIAEGEMMMSQGSPTECILVLMVVVVLLASPSRRRKEKPHGKETDASKWMKQRTYMLTYVRTYMQDGIEGK